MKKLTVILTINLIATGCASQLPRSGNFVESFTDAPECQSTKLSYDFISEPDNYWKNKISNSTRIANSKLISSEFAKACQKLKLNRTNGKTVQDVCREIACSGDKVIKFGFFHDEKTKAIAREIGGIVEFNTAKHNSGAGSPGNITHEFTHTLGYTHFTNISWLGKYSVPYEVGYLVDSLSK